MNRITAKKILLFTGDIALLYTALFITVWIRYYPNLSTTLWLRHVIPFTLLFIIWIFVFFINNLYAIERVKNDFKFYGQLIQILIINALIGFTFFYLSPEHITSLRPFRVLIFVITFFTFFIIIWRRIFYSLTVNKRLSNRVLFVGLNAESIELMTLIGNNPQWGYVPAAVIAFSGDPQLPESLSPDIARLKEIANLQQTIREHAIQTIVLVNQQQGPMLSQYLFESLNIGLSYFTFPVFYERLTGRVPVASLERDWFLENLLAGDKKFYEVGKRITDVIASILFGVIALPLIPFIALGVKLSSTGSLLFTQVRTGKGGKTFVAMKFRTMVADAEKNGPQWAQKHDTRITSFGKFLRKTRLDELPQFINILKGDMSFVGPRPERPEFVALLNERIPFYKERLLVQPGLSGWAQINFKYGDSVEDALTKLQYDLFYIKQRSFALDLSIIFKTIATVLRATLGQ